MTQPSATPVQAAPDRRAEVVDLCAAALDRGDAATARGDQGAAIDAAAEAGLWWAIADAYGATPQEINTRRAGGAR
ncbi:hypothetical protein RM572_26980 [Streptomyces sp. DSM 42041]|uniref:Uncharacterized protein n=1 Tax=Streptomyces hazeniae TaxID=3075538 RepID=A0ABU2NZJ8_9ACTN|nr:hypothetical protein [Streptomyces sp. DSM 42041]MDT0382409.1 hypothetical protein [Streptomyces sp. DSM 42041]